MSDQYSPDNRRTTALGGLRSGQRLYRELPPSLLEHTFSTALAARVFITTLSGRRLGEISSEEGSRNLVSVEFELTPSGCGSAKITLARPPAFPVTLGAVVTIHLYQSETPWYSGVITEIPAEGDLYEAEGSWGFEAVGFYQALERLLIYSRATAPSCFSYQTVQDIVSELARSYIAPNLAVHLNPNLIEPSTYVPAAMTCEMDDLRKTLEDAAGYSEGFIFGIDASRSFFFRAPRQQIFHLGIGDPAINLSTLEVRRDLSKVVNRLYVKGGQIVTYQNLDLYTITEDVDSQRIYGVHEDTKSIPSAVSTLDTLRWSDWFIRENAEPQPTVRADYTQVGTLPLIAGDYVRVFSTIRTPDYQAAFDWPGKREFSPEWTIVNTHGSEFRNHESGNILKCFPGSGTTLYSSPAQSAPYMYQRVEGDFEVFARIVLAAGTGNYIPDGCGIQIRETPRRYITLLWRRALNASARWYVERRDTIDGVTTINTSALMATFNFQVIRICRINGQFMTYYGLTETAPWTALSAPTVPFSSTRGSYVGLTSVTENQEWQGTPQSYEDYFHQATFFKIKRYANYYDLPLTSVKYKVVGDAITATLELGDVAKPFISQLRALIRGRRTTASESMHRIQSVLEYIRRVKFPTEKSL